MQVILLKDVPKVGRQYDLKTVADGFALNLLFPKGLAELATKEKIAVLEEKQKAIAHLREADSKAIEGALARLDGIAVTISAGKANDKGTLFKGVDADDVAAALGKAAGTKIDTDTFDLPSPIKTTGAHKLSLKAGNVTAECTLMVEAAK